MTTTSLYKTTYLYVQPETYVAFVELQVERAACAGSQLVDALAVASVLAGAIAASHVQDCLSHPSYHFPDGRRIRSRWEHRWLAIINILR
jgi:hypothetical protein